MYLFVQLSEKNFPFFKYTPPLFSFFLLFLKINNQWKHRNVNETSFWGEWKLQVLWRIETPKELERKKNLQCYSRNMTVFHRPKIRQTLLHDLSYKTSNPKRINLEESNKRLPFSHSKKEKMHKRWKKKINGNKITQMIFFFLNSPFVPWQKISCLFALSHHAKLFEYTQPL